MNKYPKLLASSVDPYKFSMTARGVLRMAVPVIMALAPLLSVNVDDLNNVFNSVNSFLDSLDTLIAAGLALWASFEVIVGALRKIAVTLGWMKINS